MRNRARTKSRLIREDSTGNTLLHTHKHTADNTARHCRRVKSASDDRAKYRRQSPCMNHNNTKSKNHIEKRHKRHQLLRYSSDSFDSAKQNHAYQNRDHNTDNKIRGGNLILPKQMIIQQSRIDRCRDRIDLCRISCTKHGQYAECRKQIRQKMPFLIQPVLYVIHRSADQFPIRILFPEMHRKCNLRILRTHTKQRRDPHPEHRAGTTDCDRSGHTGDISGTNRCCERRTNRLKRRHCSI